MPSMERRINLYLNYKLFSEPPLQCSPTWIDKSEIVNLEMVALINPMISPNVRDVVSFKLFGSGDCGFNFDRLGTLQLS